MASQNHPFNYNQLSSSSFGYGSTVQQPSRSMNGLQYAGRLPAHATQLPGHSTSTSSGVPHFSSGGFFSQFHSQQSSPNSGGSYVTGVQSLSHTARAYGGPAVMNNCMPNSTFTSSPALDLSEFPSLTNRNSQENSNSASSGQNPMSGRLPYVGMVKQPTSESSEFHIHSEDFPALPGSQSVSTHDSTNKSASAKGLEAADSFQNKASAQSGKSAAQSSKDGFIRNIPPGVISDQYGMLGLLSFMHTAETDPKLVSLALGTDLTTLGLNLNTTGNLYPTFGGPWAENPCKPQDIEYNVPAEYLINQNIQDKLAPVKLSRYGDDLLFFMFYMYGGDVLQVAAAAELFSRDWRFHKDERVWITRVPGMVPAEKTATYERGMYYFFDPENWKKIPKEFQVYYDRLEERATVPPTAPI